MKTFALEAEFTDAVTEREIIAGVANRPELFRGIRDLLADSAFREEAQAWESVKDAINRGQNPPRFDDWRPSLNLKASVERVADLFCRRVVAGVVEEIVEPLYRPEITPHALLAQLEHSLIRVQAQLQKNQTGRLVWAANILADLFRDAERRQQERERTGLPVMGLPTGIAKLDEILGGLEKGLYILGGPPGVGKTSFALQMAGAVAVEVPVIFVTFENAPDNLTLKAICERSVINTQDVRRGTCDLKKLCAGAIEWERDVAPRLAFIEGASQLSVAQLGARAVEAMGRHKLERCLIVVDYLQLWAKTAIAYRKLDTARGRVEALSAELRQLAMHLKSPVLAICSQNRAQGDYGDGTGRTSLDSLKESGDLEYACDVAMFLVGSKNRSAMPTASALELIIKKNRDGRMGLVHLVFRPDISRLRAEESCA